MRVQFALCVLLIGLVDLESPKTANAAVTINMTNQAMTAWLINGANPNGTLTLTRGQTYSFVVAATGHPFFITSVPGNNPVVPLVDSGLSGNGTASGTVTFTPSSTTPASFSYQCSAHAAMTGTINLVAAAPVPAVGTWGLLAFGVLLMAAGTVAVRRSRRG
jgi:plastocyanin